ncbi:MAG TPA: hypothetical protein VGB07_25130 [Blastocatellia bacterium]
MITPGNNEVLGKKEKTAKIVCGSNAQLIGLFFSAKGGFGFDTRISNLPRNPGFALATIRSIFSTKQNFNPLHFSIKQNFTISISASMDYTSDRRDTYWYAGKN